MTELRFDIELDADLDARADAIAYRVFQAVDKGAMMVTKEAAANAPTDEGTLKGSLNYQTDVDADGSIQARVGSALEYAPYVEYGTGKVGAQSPKAKPGGHYRMTGWTYWNPKAHKVRGKDGRLVTVPPGYVYTEGRPADGFLRDALYIMEPEIRADIADAVKKGTL